MTQTVSFRVADIYQVHRILGQGGYGHVYRAVNVKTYQAVAIKTEIVSTENGWTAVLPFEAAIYATLRGIPGIPTVEWHGIDRGVSFMVMDVVGPTLQHLAHACRGRLSLRTVCMLAEQLITRLESVHERGIIVRDVKPSNIAMGVDFCSNTAYVLDFGFARNYIDPDTGSHIPFVEGRPEWIGTLEYCSANMQSCKEASRRDDMESLGYVLLFLLNGSLPWSSVYAPDRSARGQWTAAMKTGRVLSDFAASSGPEFTQYFEHVRSLSFEQRPDYTLLRELFRKRMRDAGWPCDWVFDWVSPGATPWGTLLPDEYVFDKAFIRAPYIQTV